MPTDLPNDDTSPDDRYAYKASLIGSAHQFELTDKGLSWKVGGRSGVWAYTEISAISLSYRPMTMQSRRFRADISRAGGGRIKIRIVKGAYLEPASIAFRKKSDVDENFYKLACRVLTAGARQTGAFLQIATHDERLIDRLGAFTGHGPVPASNYEHAMLYGIQRPLQRRIARAGRPLRVLISYGDNWFPWYMRRLAERPANVWFIVKSIFAR